MPRRIQASAEGLQLSERFKVCIGIVSTEELIPCVSGEGYRHVLPCHGTHQQRCDLGGIRHRLIEPLGKLPQQLFPFFHGKDLGLVLRSEIAGKLFCRLRFVELRFPETDGKGLYGCHRKLLHLRDDQAGIHSVAQEGPQRYIADHPKPDRILKQRIQLSRRIFKAPGKRRLPEYDILHGPVPPLLRPQRRPLQDLTREQLVRVPEDTLSSRDILRRKVHGQCVPVDLFPESRVFHDRLQFGGKDQPFAFNGVIKRLYSHPVPDQVQALLLPVKERKGKHAVETLHRIDAPSLIGTEYHFGIRPCPKLIPLPFQLLSQFEIIIDFSVETDNGTAALRGHRLAAVGAQVQNGESAVRKAEPEAALQCLQHIPLIIRSPVSDLIDHLTEKLLRTESPVYKSTDSAHSDFLSRCVPVFCCFGIG